MVSEARRLGVQESKIIDHAKQHHTPHCWLVARQSTLQTQPGENSDDELSHSIF